MNAETFGDRVKRARERIGMSKCALARRVGCTEAEIRQLESGRTPQPRLLTGLKIARALGEPIEYLAFGNAERA